MTPDMPQRVAVVVEQNKSGTWGVAAYLVTADGNRYRRALATLPTFDAATRAVKAVWEKIEGPDGQSS